MSQLYRRLRKAAAILSLDMISAVTPRRWQLSPRQRIGVFLFWGIGDAVLTTPFLRQLRATYPSAHIVAVGKPWLAELLADEGLFDEIQVLAPPWTKHHEKYRLWAKEWRTFLGNVRRLSKIPFDLLISLRPDPREVMLAQLLDTVEFAGYAVAGGRKWITIDVGRSVRDESSVFRGELAARASKTLLGVLPPSLPRLASNQPPRALFSRLWASGYAGGPILAVAFSATHPTRQWRGDRIAAVLRGISQPLGAVLVIEAEGAPQIQYTGKVPLLRWQGPLSELKGVLATADVLLCTDSGTLHVGTAVGCRTVAIFGPGSIPRFAPRGPGHTTVAVEPMPCRPCQDSCLHASPLCMERIDPAEVASRVDAALAAVSTPRIAPLALERMCQ